MCLGVPMQVIEVDNDTALVEMDGVRREASLMMLPDQVSVGDYLIVHAGFAISRLDKEEAEETLRLMRELFDPEDMQ